jgi:glutaminase
MNTRLPPDETVGAPYVSTGHLPSSELVKALVAEAHSRYQSNTEGQTSQVYPELARVRADLFGTCVVGTNGNLHAVGDSDYEFTIMSVSKPFVFALVCELLGPDQVREKVGVNPPGGRSTHWRGSNGATTAGPTKW